ncbi:MAG: hypothetical protein V3S43_06175 [Acidimicrobiia bacterium]
MFQIPREEIEHIAIGESKDPKLVVSLVALKDGGVAIYVANEDGTIFKREVGGEGDPTDRDWKCATDGCNRPYGHDSPCRVKLLS